MKKIRKISMLLLTGILIVALNQSVLAAEAQVNINTATKEELMTLKYVGEKIADRIVEYRELQPFEKPEDIMNVKGIGNKVYEANKDMIIVKDEVM